MQKCDLTGKDVRTELEILFFLPVGNVEITNGDITFVVSQQDMDSPTKWQKYTVRMEDFVIAQDVDFETLVDMVEEADRKNSWIWEYTERIREALQTGEDFEKLIIPLEEGKMLTVFTSPIPEEDGNKLFFALDVTPAVTKQTNEKSRIGFLDLDASKQEIFKALKIIVGNAG